MPEGVEEIGKVAFKGCDLREFVLPSTIKKLGKSFLGADYESANPQMTDNLSLGYLVCTLIPTLGT